MNLAVYTSKYILLRDPPLIMYANFQKIYISSILLPTRAYQGVRNVGLSENFACILVDDRFVICMEI